MKFEPDFFLVLGDTAPHIVGEDWGTVKETLEIVSKGFAEAFNNILVINAVGNNDLVKQSTGLSKKEVKDHL